MQNISSLRLYYRWYFSASALTIALLAGYSYLSPAPISAADASLLGGRVASAGKQALAGIPVRAHRENSNITVIAYTNARGEFAFPAGSDLTPGSYAVAIELPDFEPVKRDGITIAAGK